MFQGQMAQKTSLSAFRDPADILLIFTKLTFVIYAQIPKLQLVLLRKWF